MLTSGTRLGPYEVVAPIGAGGMGEVYRARDTRLDRTVAIKILPPAFASNAQLRQRFEREARLISQLSHPHICTIHDVGHDSGVDYLVMEHLEGETLADRLLKGPLPVEKAVRHAIEIADALEKAHRQGIVHRDLKPANVMLTRGGAKLLDFGLAKTADAPVDGNAPTVQKALTEEGTVVGTVQYMAPEQLEGLSADARTDIFAFGALLYEMLTGKRAFDGKTRTSVIAAIVERDPPPVSQFQPLTPAALERLIRNCLAKDPDDRWQTAHDVLLELRAIGDSDSSTAIRPVTAGRRRKSELAAWTLAVLFLAAAAIAGIAYWKGRHVPRRVVRASIAAPPGVRLEFYGDNASALTISPDGQYVTFVAPWRGVSLLWVRRLDQTEAQPLAGTDSATYPFWSPDSKQIAFFANRKLKRVAPTGGAVVTITDYVRDSRGGAWGANDVILYSTHWRSALYRVNAGGGKVTQLTRLDESKRETTHRFPYFLPDGEHFLYLAGSHLAESTSGENAIYVASVRGGERKLLTYARANAMYVAGHLLFHRDGRLMAQRFDTGRLALEGDPFPIVDDVRYDKGFFRAVFAATADTLVYQRGGAQTESELVWFDRTGKRTGTVGEPAEYFDVVLSPDGSQVLTSIDDPSDLWAFDVKRGVRTRVTSGPYGEQNPVYSPDGSTFLFASDRNTLFDTYRRAVTGRPDEVALLAERGVSEYPCDWIDGFVIYEREDLSSNMSSDVWALPLGGGKPFPLVQTEATENMARVSPDRRWLAYASNETGRTEVYVTSFPAAAGKWQVSQEGGYFPQWRGDGRELFFSDAAKVFAVPVAAGATFEAGTPVALFEARVKSLPPPFYAAAADGQRFLVNTLPVRTSEEGITVITNWTAELKP